MFYCAWFTHQLTLENFTTVRLTQHQIVQYVYHYFCLLLGFVLALLKDVRQLSSYSPSLLLLPLPILLQGTSELSATDTHRHTKSEFPISTHVLVYPGGGIGQSGSISHIPLTPVTGFNYNKVELK